MLLLIIGTLLLALIGLYFGIIHKEMIIILIAIIIGLIPLILLFRLDSALTAM